MAQNDAPGADKATDELLPCPFCGNEQLELEDCRLQWCVSCKCSATVLGERSPERDGTESDDYWRSIRKTAVTAWNRRSSLAAVPASEPTLTQRMTAAGFHRRKSGIDPEDSQWYAEPTAAPAPVSGMPDLALDVPNDALRTALAFMGFIDSDVQALAAKFALPVQTMAEILQHVNVLPALQAPDAPVAPAEVYQWRRRIEGQPWFDGSKEMAYQRVDENYEARMLYAAPAVAAPLPAAPAPTEQAGMVERMCRDFPALQAFHEKYALGPMLAPSCLCCGQQTHAMTRPVAIKHGELPGIVICAECRDGAAIAARRASDTDNIMDAAMYHMLTFNAKQAGFESAMDAVLTACLRQAPDSRDAERYRWLRDKSDPGISAFYLSVGKAFDGVKFNQDTVDCAIDAQIAAQDKAQ